MIFDFTQKSEIGTRETQQDYALCYSEGNFFSAVVCDGMGGLEGGAIASRSAAELLMDFVKKRDPNESIPDMLLRSVDVLDEKVFNIKDEFGEKIRAGTTIVSVVIEGRNLFWLSVGDSRLYIMRQSEFIQATRDHNYNFILKNMPEEYCPTPEEIEKKYALISFIGIGGIEVLDVSQNPLQLMENDVVLLTTDGLFNSLTDKQIHSVLMKESSLEERADELLRMVKKESFDNRDNITFVIIQIGEIKDETI